MGRGIRQWRYRHDRGRRSRDVVLYSTTADAQVRAALRTLVSAFRPAPARAVTA
ncbi:hypothetical protein LGM65_23120 [Burkholderia anthina]|uniref:hypothetical protein n=1 Tax=Burkholderia anthina TaxID=179879 RepID=UPI001CF32B80|nr:hypothetical protein [Burkholderia anthina]MCA8093743.1 hypothetical protein [Burkholderia anthina]